MMYVVYVKKTNEWYDFVKDPSIYLNNSKYGFDRTSEKQMYKTYEQIGQEKIPFYEPNEQKWSYEDREDTPSERKEQSLLLLREYNVYTIEPLSSKIEPDIKLRLEADLDTCAEIVAANGENTETAVPIIDYI